jgi:ribosomal protein L30E
LDSGVRVYAHVLRHLPVHHRTKTRLDVGRRAERAFVILTRAVGGEEFYRCLLK